MKTKFSLCFIYYLLRDETDLPIINFVVFDDFGDTVVRAKKKAHGNARNEYVVLASKDVQQDVAWMQVVNALKEKHGAEIFFYEKAPRENLADLQRVKPVTWRSWKNRKI